MNSVDELNLLLGIGPKRPQLPLTLRKSGYLPVRALGKGSYGQALLVFHEPQQQYFVVKHLNLAGMTSRQRHDAHNEIRILQRLQHPNIVRYVEYFEEHPHLYIVMEYADGGDVFTLLSSVQAARKAAGRAYREVGRAPSSSSPSSSAALLSEAQVVSLFVQTTMAVKYMHDRRLLHRDIKSSNIFLTKNHVVKLGDFGISTALQSTMAMASTMCGTPCYFSPELCQGRPYNSKSDMWALGVLLFELCAGHVPFESTTIKALMRDIVYTQPPRIPSAYSEPLWELVTQLLQKDPHRRPDAGQVLMSAVLMKYVPELIEQLSADQVYVRAPGPSSHVQDIGPKKGQEEVEGQRQQKHVLNRKEVEEAEVVAAARAKRDKASSAAPPQPSSASSSAAGGAVSSEQHHNQAAAAVAAAVVPPPPPPPPRQPRGPPLHGVKPANETSGTSSPSSSPPPFSPPTSQQSKQDTANQPRSTQPAAASIQSLLARFDAQKQQLAEKKMKTRQQQQEDTSNNGNGSRDSDVVGLSPGAAAALRQQGWRVEAGLPAELHGDCRHGSEKPIAEGYAPEGARPTSRAFAPPPLPAALRSQITQHEGVRTGAGEAPGNGHHKQREAELNNEDGEAGLVSPPLPSSQELDAVLSELSSWRHRSLNRQRKSPPEAKGLAQPQHPKATPGNSKKDTPSSPAAPHLSGGTHQRADVAASGALNRGPSVRANAETQREGVSAHKPSDPASPSPQAPQRTADNALSPTRSTAVETNQLNIEKAPVQNGEPDEAAAAQVADDDDDVSAQSFVDVLGTTLDIHALQAAAPLSQEGEPHHSSKSLSNHHRHSKQGTVSIQADGLRGGAASSSIRHNGCQSMHQSFRGASDKPDVLRATLTRLSMGETLHQAIHRAREAGVAGVAVPGSGGGRLEGKPATSSDAQTAASAEGASPTADVHFTSSCLCGRVKARHGCLSMIYGSFVCGCDVCVRFTGAAAGVEWLHLPEVEGLEVLLHESACGKWKRKEERDETNGHHAPPAFTPSPPSSPLTRRLSAGNGAAAVMALRAQAAQRTEVPSRPANGGPDVSSNTAAEGSTKGEDEPHTAYGQAGVRVYVHHRPRTHDTEEDEGAAVCDAAEAEAYVLYTCQNCGGLLGMRHDDVDGLLVPKATLDGQSLTILLSCAQAVLLSEADDAC